MCILNLEYSPLFLNLINYPPVKWARSGNNHTKSCRHCCASNSGYLTHAPRQLGAGHFRLRPEVASILYLCLMRTRSFSPRFYNRQMTLTSWPCIQIYLERTIREWESLLQKCSAVSMAINSLSKPNLNRLNSEGGKSHKTFPVGLQIVLWLRNGCFFISTKYALEKQQQRWKGCYLLFTWQILARY